MPGEAAAVSMTAGYHARMGWMLAAALALVAALAGCGVPTAAPPAVRSCPTVATGAEDKYLCWLQTYGFNVTAETRQSLLVAGDMLCKGLRAGGTPEEGVAVIYRVVPDISEKQAGLLITAAQFGLCPDTM